MTMNPDQGNKFKMALEAAFADFDIEALSALQVDQLDKHYSMMCQWNRHTNLTRITEPDEAAQLHYAESLWGERFIDDSRAILDIGSGAGFPGVPLAVMRSDVLVTALESNQKKTLFLNEVKDALGLANFRIVNVKIEDFDWANHDLLISRALDHGERVLASVAGRLRPPQRLMLYCAPDLADRLAGHIAKGYEAEFHPIPQFDARLIAIYRSL